MSVEAAPQTRLKSKVTTAQTAVTAYQTVNAKVAALKTAAQNVGDLATWRGIKATSSNTTVTATALTGTNGAAGTTSFKVANLAKNQVTTAAVDPEADITGVTKFTITVGNGSVDKEGNSLDKVYEIEPKKLTAQGIADAINAKGIPVKAAVVTTGGDKNILQFSSTKTGEVNKFTIGGLDGVGTTDVTPAQNALLEIAGGSGAGGYDVVNDSNTFTKLMPGVSITVAKAGEEARIEASQDISGIAAKFAAMVDAANATLDEISKQTAYDAANNKASTLTGDFSVRNMTQTLLGTVSKGVIYPNPEYDPKTKTAAELENIPKTISAGSYADFGIRVGKGGRLTFDETAFNKSYAEDPARVQQVGTEIGGVFRTVADNQSTNLKSTITGRTSEIDSLNTQISNWDVRLATKRLALQKQYSDLEVALGKLKNQSNWLAGQLGGLG
jgi:flagellar hook-associated protein 2